MEEPSLNIETILKLSDQLFRSESASDAVTLLSTFLEEKDNPHAWLKLARAYMILGEEVVARAILRNVIFKINKPHVLYLIAARVPYCKPLILEDRKLIYFNIPKCGSSTLKDTILLAEGAGRHGEMSHFRASVYEKIISFKDLETQYADYQTIMVVRHPRDRLRSYWTKNLAEKESLTKEAGGRQTFYGLNPRPSYNEILANFARYRSVFLDFRHHTDSIVGYAGQQASRIKHIFPLSEISKAMDMLQLPETVEQERPWNMQSGRKFDFGTCDLELEKEVINNFYQRELSAYFGENPARDGADDIPSET